MSTANEIEKQKLSFSLVGLNWGLKIRPCEYPRLEVNAAAFWYGDRYPFPDTDILKKGIITTIEQAFGARSTVSSLPVRRIEEN